MLQKINFDNSMVLYIASSIVHEICHALVMAGQARPL